MPSRRRYRLAFLMIGGVSALFTGRAAAFTPESPEVKQRIERGLKWLENEDDPRLGGQCLIGLSFLKAGRPLSHAKIVAARAACETLANTELQSLDNYSAGLALVFLLETDPERNRSLAQRYMTRVASAGSSLAEAGDIQATRRATPHKRNIRCSACGWRSITASMCPRGAIERACGWLLRTQDPSGGWGYQGQDPGRLSDVLLRRMCGRRWRRPAWARCISAPICWRRSRVKPQGETPTGMPSALKPVGDPLDNEAAGRVEQHRRPADPAGD